MMFRGLGSILLVLCLAVAVAACGTDSSSSKSKAATPSSASTHSCSAGSLSLTLPVEAGLPAPVAATRTRLFDAAMSCNFEQLGAVALTSRNFGFTYGGEKDPVAYWRKVDAKQHTLARLAQLLTTPFVKRTDGGINFAWPSVYQDKPTAGAYVALVKTGAYSQAEASAFEKGGSYHGYRISIDPAGDWRFFLTGD